MPASDDCRAPSSRGWRKKKNRAAAATTITPAATNALRLIRIPTLPLFDGEGLMLLAGLETETLRPKSEVRRGRCMRLAAWKNVLTPKDLASSSWRPQTSLQTVAGPLTGPCITIVRAVVFDRFPIF